ncbi:MAG: hypothetical protein KJ732_05110 [Candidatus Margulisbacteria bacterium]|nr:hypothetical protein [Candidatus Margulisiibacteriota bacterium]
MLEFITDIIVGLNIVLILSSVFLVLEIFRSVGRDDLYVLAKGWKYLVPAVIIMAVLRVYDFFIEYSIYTSSRVVQESMYLVFTVFLFSGLLVQYLAIKKTLDSRE